MRPDTDRKRLLIPPARLLTAVALLATFGLTAAGGPPDGALPDGQMPAVGAPDAGRPSAAIPGPGEPATATAPPAAGLVVYVDPRTGKLTDEPTRQQVEALSDSLKSSLSRSTAGLETFALADGGHGVDLAGRFRTATVARPRPDGTWGLACVDRPDEAAAAIEDAPAAPVWEEK